MIFSRQPELRGNAIEILLSIICLPLRYPGISLEDLEGLSYVSTLMICFLTGIDQTPSCILVFSIVSSKYNRDFKQAT